MRRDARLTAAAVESVPAWGMIAAIRASGLMSQASSGPAPSLSASLPDPSISASSRTTSGAVQTLPKTCANKPESHIPPRSTRKPSRQSARNRPPGTGTSGKITPGQGSQSCPLGGRPVNGRSGAGVLSGEPSTAPTFGSPSAVSAYTPSASSSNERVLSTRSADEAQGIVIVALASGLTGDVPSEEGGFDPRSPDRGSRATASASGGRPGVGIGSAGRHGWPRRVSWWPGG